MAGGDRATDREGKAGIVSLSPYYEHGGVTIFWGDCLDVLPALLTSADALVTDPPFAFTGGISNGAASQASGQFFRHWWRDVCRELVRVLPDSAEGFTWCDWRTAPIFADGFAVDQRYTWRLASMLYHYREMPGQGSPFRSSVDQIAYVRGPKSKGARIPNTTHNHFSSYWYYGKHEFHPAEKDPKIAQQLIEWCSDPGHTILDAFCGSGSVLLAARACSRRAIGIEIEERYCEVAAKRLSQQVLPLEPGLREVG